MEQTRVKHLLMQAIAEQQNTLEGCQAFHKGLANKCLRERGMFPDRPTRRGTSRSRCSCGPYAQYATFTTRPRRRMSRNGKHVLRNGSMSSCLASRPASPSMQSMQLAQSERTKAPVSSASG
eukprot:5983303-Prymnesium_polylepis.1